MCKKQVGPYQFYELVSANSYWQMYKASNKLNQPFTVKQISVQDYHSNPLLEDTVINEIECYKSLERNQYYPGLQRFVNTLKSSNNIYLIYEQIHEVSVTPLTIDQSIKYFNHCVLSLSHIHRQGYIHGDVHANTIRLANGDQALITGGYYYRQDCINHLFEVTKEGNPLCTSYLPPEVIKGHQVTVASDIYQLGITFYLWLEGKLPFKGEALSDKEQLNIRFSNLELYPNIRQILRGMLQPDPTNRITLRQIHLIMNNYDLADLDESIQHDRLNESKHTREEIRQDLKNIPLMQGEPAILPFGFTRNKYMFLLNVSCAILDMKVSDNCLLCSLITTRLAQAINFSLLMSLRGPKGDEQIKAFELVVSDERAQMGQCFEIQVTQIAKTLGQSVEQLKFGYEGEQLTLSSGEKTRLVTYARELKLKVDGMRNENQHRRNIMTHLNNILDCIRLDEFFSEFMHESEFILLKQPYFLMIENLTEMELYKLIQHKLQNLAWL